MSINEFRSKVRKPFPKDKIYEWLCGHPTYSQCDVKFENGKLSFISPHHYQKGYRYVYSDRIFAFVLDHEVVHRQDEVKDIFDLLGMLFEKETIADFAAFYKEVWARHDCSIEYAFELYNEFGNYYKKEKI